MMAGPISTTAPLPQWRHFAALFRPSLDDDEILLKPWLNPGDSPFLFSRAAGALDLLAMAWAASQKRKPIVWLPDYFCNQATLLLRRDATVIFYPITESREPDWGVCAEMAHAGPPDLFVLVHYFGYPADGPRAREFCDRQGAILIEDAAHVLHRSPGLGDIGDCTIWSLYKHLPLPDGGLLTLRPNGPIDPEQVRTVLESRSRATPTAKMWIVKRFVQSMLPLLAARLSHRSPPFDVDPIATLDELAGMSPGARRILGIGCNLLAGVADCRRANAHALSMAMTTQTGLISVLPDLDASWVPYRAVFKAETRELTRDFYESFAASGNAVETWPDLAPEVRSSPALHRVALSLRETTFMMPVHADRKPSDLVSAYLATDA